jgi:hypothetical protein
MRPGLRSAFFLPGRGRPATCRHARRSCKGSRIVPPRPPLDRRRIDTTTAAELVFSSWSTQEFARTSSIGFAIGAGPPHIASMAEKTTKREEGIDPKLDFGQFSLLGNGALQVFLMPAGIFARSRARPGPTKNSVYPYILGHFAHPPLRKLAKVKLRRLPDGTTMAVLRGHLNRPASRLRFHDAVEFGVHPNSWGGGDKQIPIIATRAAELKQRRATVVHRDTEVHWPVAEIDAVEKVGRYRKQQLENGIAVTAACAFDPTENEQNRLAPCAVAQGNRTAGVSYDLWRFSCEMPDAPHLCNN